MNRYTIRGYKYGDTECPMSKLQDLENKIEDGVLVEASDVAREILAEIDNALHDMAMEYANAGHNTYFAVCEMVHHKVIRPIENKYESEEKR